MLEEIRKKKLFNETNILIMHLSILVQILIEMHYLNCNENEIIKAHFYSKFCFAFTYLATLFSVHTNN